MKNTRSEPDISSSSNAKFKLWKSLLTSQGVRKNGLALVAGEKIIQELPSDIVETWLFQASDSRPKQPGYSLSAELFHELNEAQAPGPLAVVRRPTLKKASLNQAPQGLELLLALQDPSNLGAALRVAEAFSAKKVILLKECTEPFLPKTSRASSGSNFRVPIELGPSLKDLEIKGPVIALDLTGEPIQNFSWPKAVRLFVGIEGPGVPKNFDAHKVKIEMSKNIDSLNVVSALSIACFSYQTQKAL